jgi:hypothetical protein
VGQRWKTKMREFSLHHAAGKEIIGFGGETAKRGRKAMVYMDEEGMIVDF